MPEGGWGAKELVRSLAFVLLLNLGLDSQVSHDACKEKSWGSFNHLALVAAAVDGRDGDRG